jgi:uncharacterized protein (TIGR02453 family)
MATRATASKPTPIFTRETFQFFKDLARHNQKTWMDANRERYRQHVTLPFRRLLEVMTQDVLALDSGFDVMARGGRNFSRINRDTRFAKDKTPYRAQMYLKLGVPFPGGGESGQLYVGLTKDVVTVGFRIYSASKFKESALARVAAVRVAEEPAWLAKQRKRLGSRCESYWYSAEKGDWTQRPGWPTPAEWPSVRGWIVRCKMKPAAAIRESFPREVAKIFRDLYPLLRFTCLSD